MDGDTLSFIDAYFTQSLGALQASYDDTRFKTTLEEITAKIVESLRRQGKIMFAGNGGSAGDAQHIAGEFVSRLNFDRAPLAGLALTCDTSILTSVGNDYGFADVFSRQIAGLGRRGDVFIAITTSGNSLNIIKAARIAREMEILTVGFTGRSSGLLAPECDICLSVPSDSTPLIQQVHMVAAHLICGLVEQAMFPGWRQKTIRPPS